MRSGKKGRSDKKVEGGNRRTERASRKQELKTADAAMFVCQRSEISSCDPRYLDDSERSSKPEDQGGQSTSGARQSRCHVGAVQKVRINYYESPTR